MPGRAPVWPARSTHTRLGALGALLLAFAALLAFATGARAQARALPPQGVFESCDSSTIATQCDARLAQIAAAGFQVVVVPLAPYGAAMTAYLQTLKADHLQAVWELDDPGWWGEDPSGAYVGYDPGGDGMLDDGVYASYAQGCGCTTNDQLLAFIAQTLTASGATWGWYIADDSQITGQPASVVPGLLAGLQTLTVRLRTLAPATRTIVSSWGETDMTQFTQALPSADLVAQEAYPLLDQPPSPSSTSLEAQTLTATAQDTALVAAEHDAPLALVLQAFSWGECSADAQLSGASPSARYPDASELLAMRNAALANSTPSLLLWYDFAETVGWPTGETPADCSAPPDPVQRLAALTAAVQAPRPATESSIVGGGQARQKRQTRRASPAARRPLSH